MEERKLTKELLLLENTLLILENNWKEGNNFFLIFF